MNRVLISSYKPDFQAPALNSAELHIWCFSMAEIDEHVQRFRSILSSDEKERAATFRFDKDASRFVFSRGLLRHLLGQYTGDNPEALRFCYGSYGKPKLTKSDLEFNLSHSKRLVAYAFCRSHAVGIDVESAKELDDVDSVARQCLSSAQLEQFRQLDWKDKSPSFHRFWTRKEALIKATGQGLSQELRDFDVTFGEEEPVSLTRAQTGFDNVEDWKLIDIQLSERDYAAAAIHNRRCHLKFVACTTNQS